MSAGGSITSLSEAVAALGALPMPVPVGPEPRTLDVVEHELTGARLSLYEEELETARLRLALKSAQRGRRELRGDCEFAEGSRQRWRTACINAERERDELRARVTELEAERHSTNEALDDAVQALRADRAPEVFVPQTERSRWVAIADALNAAHSAGMPVGIDMDGTLTDHNAWSVVWDRAADRWAVAGYEDGFPALDVSSKETFAERADRESDPARRTAWRMLAEPEPEFHAYLRHPYRTGHDLPETGGVQ